MSKYHGTVLKLTDKGSEYQPHWKPTNTNLESWDVIRSMFKLRHAIPFEDLATATKGHIHGTLGMDDTSSHSYVCYCIRSGWLEVSK